MVVSESENIHVYYFENNRWQIIVNNGRIKDVEYMHEIQNLITFLKW